MCGEQFSDANAVVRMRGSPPRVRGTGVAVLGRSRTHRITPACAGNSMCLTPLAACRWDHPRVCGEQCPAQTPGQQGLGSPPRVRGTAGMCDCVAQAWGITPACAGNSCAPASPGPSASDHPRVCGEQAMRMRN